MSIVCLFIFHEICYPTSKDVLIKAPSPGGDPKEDEKDDEEAEVDGELGHQESRTIRGLHKISLEHLVGKTEK